MRTFVPKTKTINILLLDGGVGDHVASLVAIDYIIKNYTWITPLIWVPDFLLDLSKHLLPASTQVLSFSQMRGKYQPSKPTKTTKWDGNTSPMKIHCVDYAFLKLCDENPSIEHKNYLQIRPDHIDISKFNLSAKKYIVITAGYTAEVREFPFNHINTTLLYALARGLEVVFLGQTQTKTGSAHVIKGTFSAGINFDGCINLIDKTNLLEAAKIIHESVAVLGVDNGLLHIAGCTQAPIIGGFTTVAPELRMAIREGVLGHNYYPVVPDSDLKCNFCQSKTNFLYGHNYTKCLYDDALCTSQMTADKFINKLEIILKERK